MNRDQMQGPRYESPVTADDKVAIVTGANTGIGYETTIQLAKRGARVYMACRDMKTCDKARRQAVYLSSNKHIYCRQCDLSSQQSIRDFVKKCVSQSTNEE